MPHIPMLNLRAEYLYMKHDIDAAIGRCLDHQEWIFGPEVTALEEKLADYVGTQHCIGTSSGTDALVIALRALAIKTKGREYFDRSDLIITTPFTFTATGTAILRSGATPLFVDINPTDYNINPNLISYCLKMFPQKLFPAPFKEARIVGIIPVHLFGKSCRMDRVMATARRYGLFVVEDCAQAFGASWDEQKVGAIGDVGCFSFFPSKNLGGFGDAGAITTNDNEISALIRMLIKHGGIDKYNVSHVGYNARLDTFQAAILLAKMNYFDEFTIRRWRIAQTYTEALQGVPGIRIPTHPQVARSGSDSLTSSSRCAHVFHQYTLRILDSRRSALQKYLASVGISSIVYYPFTLNIMKVFSNNCLMLQKLKVASKISSEVLSIPIEPLQVNSETSFIIEHIKNFFGQGEQRRTTT